MHSERPLKPDYRALHNRQKGKAQQGRKRKPNQEVQPQRRLIKKLHIYQGRHNDVSGDKDREIGRRVIGPMMKQLLAA